MSTQILEVFIFDQICSSFISVEELTGLESDAIKVNLVDQRCDIATYAYV